MLMKTSNSSYGMYRLLTLQAAANLYGCYSVVFSKVRDAWDAVSMPVQPGEPAYCGPQN
jgi:zinc metalloprotease ZmpA